MQQNRGCNFGQRIEIFKKHYEKTRIRPRGNEPKGNLRNNPQRALRSAEQLRQIKRIRFFIPNVPQSISRGILGNPGLGFLQHIIVIVHDVSHLLVYLSLERSQPRLLFEL